ncbi:DegT/DnrJ/EryC1/StrS aminotransferase [Magnetococcus marinus MC-1]|uniref:DegT/DnrJ/EryC1/StrS aminotransferase n=1 Tax=Magnetococcus marinus (strain ATCC BAA-1437 / JCM 17883 / MC-1) TaxID=156889 RepID=A0LE30_MAGMM|nr:DegT/DnrJ/EryC1/StrS family aminotransferase [Magnetococcus marinus]ABK46223.1 DegT/DnrJ/EryC1/StrS aminotransferase [Magnetococcus marinus MC-1]
MQFIDLKTQYLAYQAEIDAAMKDVVDTVRFINGPWIGDLERDLAAFVGVKHAIGVSSGTDALLALLMSWGIGPGDEVITTAFTFIATAEVIALVGAKPVFVDIEPDTLNIDPVKVEAAITPNTKLILPVSLYGQCADYVALNAIGAKYGIPVLEDACQSLGSSFQGKRSCALTEAAATSFFPAKPLGCFGDGGMVFTDNDELAEKVRQVKDHGQSARYQHGFLGINGRLDSIQAAVLGAKLPHFQDEIDARQRIANRYIEGLQGHVQTPIIRAGNISVFAQFTVRVANRDAVQKVMGEHGVPTAVHYPIPLPHQPVFKAIRAKSGEAEPCFPESEKAAAEVMSLPMHPFLSEADQDKVVETLIQAVKGA